MEHSDWKCSLALRACSSPVLLLYRLELFCVCLQNSYYTPVVQKREGLLQGVHLVVSLHDSCYGTLPRIKPLFACNAQSCFLPAVQLPL